MSPHDIKAAVEQLSVWADGWVRTGAIPPIERDLALEKLRRIYEELLAVSAATAVPPMAASEASEPLSINLDEVLSVELEQPAAEPMPVSGSSDAGIESAPAEPAEANGESETAMEESEVEVELVFADEEETDEEETAAAEQESAAGVEAVSGETAALAGEPAVALSSSGPELAAETIGTAAVAPQAADGAEEAHHSATEVPEFVRPTVSIAAGKEAEAVSHAVEEAAPVVGEPELRRNEMPAASEVQSAVCHVEEEFAGAAAPASSDVAAPQEAHSEASGEASRRMVQSLFGPEDPEELRRHKTKQRILMSLYDLPETEAAAVSSARLSRPAPDFPALRAEARQVAEEPRMQDSEVSEAVGIEEVVLHEFEETVAEESAIEVVTVDEPDDVETISAPGESEPERAESAAEVLAQESVLGDVINHDVRTLADELSAARHDVASELARRESVDDLRKAIGINDKFLLIRDLFGGEAEAYEEAIDALNAFDNLDDCLIHIAEHYAWNPNSDGAKLLMELLERKLA